MDSGCSRVWHDGWGLALGPARVAAGLLYQLRSVAFDDPEERTFLMCGHVAVFCWMLCRIRNFCSEA